MSYIHICIFIYVYFHKIHIISKSKNSIIYMRNINKRYINIYYVNILHYTECLVKIGLTFKVNS